MVDDPVSEIVDENPTPAVIRTSSSGAYNPRVEDPGTGSASTPVVGFFSGKVDAGEDFSATLLLKAADRPAHLKAKLSRCVVNGTDYGVHEVRDRVWEGQINGYTLELV